MAIDPKDFELAIQMHMEDQPYKIRCSECNGDLDADFTVDSDYDLDIDVVPCQNCIDNAKQEGRDE